MQIQMEIFAMARVLSKNSRPLTLLNDGPDVDLEVVVSALNVARAFGLAVVHVRCPEPHLKQHLFSLGLLVETHVLPSEDTVVRCSGYNNATRSFTYTIICRDLRAGKKHDETTGDELLRVTPERDAS